MTEGATMTGKDAVRADPDMPSRKYVDLPGGWKLQTRGGGSTLRIYDPNGERWRPMMLGSTEETILESMVLGIAAALPAADAGKVDGVTARAKSVVERLLHYAIKRSYSTLEDYEGDLRRGRELIAALSAPKVAGAGMEAARVAEAVAAERERCAKIADLEWFSGNRHRRGSELGPAIVAAIRVTPPHAETEGGRS